MTSRYTDHEMALIADRSLKLREVADQVGISISAVSAIRKKIDAGTLKLSDWLDSEIDFVIENINRMTTQKLADFLGRTHSEVHTEIGRLRRNGLVAPKSKISMNPNTVAGRPLIAKTCPKCGHLRGAEWFNKSHTRSAGSRPTYQPNCRQCETSRSKETMREKKHREHHGKYVAKLQSYTLERAEKNGQEWTSADLEILSSTDKTTFQKALELKRTYLATSAALHRNGLTSKPDFEGMKNGEWKLFWEFELDVAEEEAA